VQYNELRIDLPAEPEGASPTEDAEDAEDAGETGIHMGGVAPMRRLYLQSAAAVPADIRQQQEGPFRRTVVPRSPRELAVLQAQMADEALELSDPAVRLYPTPSPSNCRTCSFRTPCLMVNEGNDP